jgi:nicotinate phosphoribosyltransferase
MKKANLNEIEHPELLTDFYEFSMANGYFIENLHEENATFDYFFRKNPFRGGYAILAGVNNLLEILDEFRFNEDSIEYLKSYGSLSDDFLEYLSKMNLKIDIRGIQDGRVVFANEPILEVNGPFLQCQLIETLILNCINFPTLCATKANRMWLESDKGSILEFGARRAQGPNGALIATYASMIGGCTGTSNVLAAKKLGLKALGTQAHSWIMSFPTEYEAFKKYVEIYPDSSILLVDTYDTLKSGVPNAIKIGRELKKKKKNLIGIRLDSGNLADLSKKARMMLDKAGFGDTKIIISNDVDEYLIKKFKEEGGVADTWGIGTKLVTCFDEPALGGVYKLVEFDDEPRIKLSENILKSNLPGSKSLIRQYLRTSNINIKILRDIVFLKDEFEDMNSDLDYDNIYSYTTGNKLISKHEKNEITTEILFEPLIEKGKIKNPNFTWKKARKNMENDTARLNSKYLKIDNPGLFPICLSKKLYDLRAKLIKSHQKKKNLTI